MLVVMQTDATQVDIDRVCGAITDMGYQAVPMPGGQRTAIGLVGNDGRVDDSRISALPGVAQVIHVLRILSGVGGMHGRRPVTTVRSSAIALRGKIHLSIGQIAAYTQAYTESHHVLPERGIGY